MFKEKFEKFMDRAKEAGAKAIDRCKEAAPKVAEFCEDNMYTIITAGYATLIAVMSATFTKVANDNAKVADKNIQYLQTKIEKLEEETDE